MATEAVRRMVKNDGGLVITDPSESACAGYLFLHENRAYDPAGLVEGVTTKEVVEAHNKILSQMELEGLDKNCRVGQGGYFYLKTGEVNRVQTWIGDLVAHASVKPYRGGSLKVKFTRKGKTFEGVVKKRECYGFFTCITIT